MFQLTELQHDALVEIFNLGVGRAAAGGGRAVRTRRARGRSPGRGRGIRGSHSGGRSRLPLRVTLVHGPARSINRTARRGPRGSVVRSLIRPGNSGGPLVSTSGEVLGMIFAASVTDDETGYALTADQLRDAAGLGSTRSATVGTGSCA